MLWATFKGSTVGEIVDIVQAWENGQDETGAQEFVTDVLDNVVFRFPDGSVAEMVSDTVISSGLPMVWPQAAARIARVVSGVLDARPLAGLPF